MAKIQKSAPALRFKDEQGNSYLDWEERKLGQIFTVRYGKEHKYLSDGNVPVIGTGGVIRYANGVLYSKPSVLIGRKGTIDKPQFINQPFWAIDTVFFTEIEPSNASYFVFLIVSKINWKRYNEASGLPSLSANTIKGIRVNIPSKEEQQKIASFLSSADTKIEQLGKKKVLLEQYKKGMMQKLFSQEIRFKDEQGKDYPDWEQSKLGNIGTTFNGLTGKNSTHFGKGKPYIQYLQVFQNSRIHVDGFGFVEIGENESQNKVCSGDVFFTTSSETPNEVGTASVLIDEVENTYLNSFCFGYRVNKKYLLPEYARFAFRANGFRKRVVRLAQGSTRYNLSKTSLMKIETNLPSLHEQQKIANFLSAVDKKIELVAEQLEQARAFKKGLLQQMFI